MKFYQEIPGNMQVLFITAASMIQTGIRLDPKLILFKFWSFVSNMVMFGVSPDLWSSIGV